MASDGMAGMQFEGRDLLPVLADCHLRPAATAMACEALAGKTRPRQHNKKITFVRAP